MFVFEHWTKRNIFDMLYTVICVIPHMTKHLKYTFTDALFEMYDLLRISWIFSNEVETMMHLLVEYAVYEYGNCVREKYVKSLSPYTFILILFFWNKATE